MKLRYAINGIKRNLVFTILLIGQLICAFYVLYNTVDTKKTVNAEASKISTYFKDKKVYKLKSGVLDILSDKDKLPKVNEENLKNTFNKIQSIKGLTFAHQVRFPITIESFNGHEEFKYYPPENEFEGRMFFQGNNITLNETSIKEFNIKLKEGRFFNSDENEYGYADNNPLPVVIGANYAKHFKLGDEIPYYGNENTISKAKVIGILEENQYIPTDMMAFDFKRYVDLNNYMLTGYSQFSGYRIMYDTMFGYNFMLFDKNVSDERIEDIKNEIRKTFPDNLGMKIDIVDLNGYIKAELDTFKEQDSIISITSIIIFIFISATLIISTLNSIYKRKKEFAVHIISGGTMRDLAINIFLEVVIVLIISFVISLLVIFYENKTLNLVNLKVLFLMLIVISITTTILPIIKMLKIGINHIIKGVE